MVGEVQVGRNFREVTMWKAGRGVFGRLTWGDLPVKIDGQ